jgi:uncharacterized repeat protein (TIGR01451 family)
VEEGHVQLADEGAGDYHLAWGSAAIDRGVDCDVATDIDGQMRPMPAGGRPDLGADEHTGVSLAPSGKTVHPRQAAAGEVLTYTLVLRNQGTAPTEALMVDPVPTSTTTISATASSGNLTHSDGLRWTGVITPGEPITISSWVTLTQDGVVANTAVLTDAYGVRTVMRAWVNGWWYFIPFFFATSAGAGQ